MPKNFSRYRRRNKLKSERKKNPMRKGYLGANSIYRQPGGVGFPKKIKMIHKYVSAPTQLNCVTGGMATHVFSCNDLYDPDVTGTGHQPLFFDQMALIYNHFTVIGSRIIIRVQTSEDPVGPSIGCLWIDDNTGTTATNLGMVAEQGKYKIKNFGGPNSNPNSMWKSKWSARKYFGKGVLANNDLMGSNANSPVEQSYYKFSYNTVDATSATVYITAEIQYITIWKERKEIAQS